MTSAGILRCPACGAGVAEGVRRCGYCHAPVATVRCPTCFAMNATAAVHCSGCGRDLGLEPIPRGDSISCPDCKTPMTAFDCGPGALHDCAVCGGQFVEHAALRDLLERHDKLEGELSGRRAAGVLTEVRVRYVACPVCGAMMNRKNFGAGSGVIVDVCARHGTWFDAGELPRVLAFVESGGLARLRKREAEQRASVTRERREAAIAAVPPATAGEYDEPLFPVVADLISLLFR